MIDILNLRERKLIRKFPQVSKYWERLVISIFIDIFLLEFIREIFEVRLLG